MLRVGTYGVTLRVMERRSVPEWVPTETMGTMMLQVIDFFNLHFKTCVDTYGAWEGVNLHNLIAFQIHPLS